MNNNLFFAKHVCLSLCIGLGVSFSVIAGGRSNPPNLVEGKDSRVLELDSAAASEEVKVDGLQQTLKFNFSPENRDRLRKALEDYARSVDPSHDQIEERRRAMKKSIETRFLDADNDNDGTLDRQEATEKLPQIARHFSSVDTNQDGLISLDELLDAQARILERRRISEALLEAEKQPKLFDTETLPVDKRKNKQTTDNTKKRSI
ncbi:MAG: EF-hand domain-containing protein [Methylotenera sp.]|nr:EF-hand domain-containing protein [Methylotenera sp.]MDO9234381.1 EF-hand domain-containing protein [Methylotenera sp.]MDO9389745.1 EF-hand domain-containing protein [Methylotenera sp.]MDP2101272.1 EF-hand domain-containing protein [Methylotenera sp.]MDP2280710.1 EF-hand domain-containing protein [Methylotenera sp.]